MSDFELPDDAQPRVRRLYDYWAGKRGDRRLPARADVDPLDIPDLLPFITLAEVRDGEPRFVYRLVGTEAGRLFGRDLTGQPVGTGLKPDRLPEVLARYRRVADEATCIYQRTMMQEQRNDFTPVERLMLPLGPAAGAVAMILGLVVPRDEEG